MQVCTQLLRLHIQSEWAGLHQIGMRGDQVNKALGSREDPVKRDNITGTDEWPQWLASALPTFCCQAPFLMASISVITKLKLIPEVERCLILTLYTRYIINNARYAMWHRCLLLKWPSGLSKRSRY